MLGSAECLRRSQEWKSFFQDIPNRHYGKHPNSGGACPHHAPKGCQASFKTTGPEKQRLPGIDSYSKAYIAPVPLVQVIPYLHGELLGSPTEKDFMGIPDLNLPYNPWKQRCTPRTSTLMGSPTPLPYYPSLDSPNRLNYVRGEPAGVAVELMKPEIDLHPTSSTPTPKPAQLLYMGFSAAIPPQHGNVRTCKELYRTYGGLYPNPKPRPLGSGRYERSGCDSYFGGRVTVMRMVDLHICTATVP